MRRAAVGRAAGRRALPCARAAVVSRHAPSDGMERRHSHRHRAARHVRLHEEHGRERLGGDHRRHHVQLWRHRRDDLSAGDVSGARRLASVRGLGDASSRRDGRVALGHAGIGPIAAPILAGGYQIALYAAYGIIADVSGSGSIPRRGATRSPLGRSRCSRSARSWRLHCRLRNGPRRSSGLRRPCDRLGS